MMTFTSVSGRNLSSVISRLNSTTTPLTAGSTFTGQSEFIDYPQILIQCTTDQVGKIYFDFSIDGTNWDSTFPTNSFNLNEDIPLVRILAKGYRYFRLRIQNTSASNQTYLRCSICFGFFGELNVPLNQTISKDSGATITRSTIAQDEITIGRRQGVTAWSKFAYNLDIDTGTEVAASFGGTFMPMTSADTFTISYTNGAGSNDGLGSNGALVLTFFYIDADGLPAVATHTLGNTGSDITSFTGLGINRVAVSSSGSDNKNNADITITATTATTNQAQIPAGKSVTQQAIFFTGSNHIGSWSNGSISCIRTAGGNDPELTIVGKIFNRAISTYFEVFRRQIDVAVENNIPINIPTGFRLNSTDILFFEVTTDQDNTIVSITMGINEYENA